MTADAAAGYPFRNCLLLDCGRGEGTCAINTAGVREFDTAALQTLSAAIDGAGSGAAGPWPTCAVGNQLPHCGAVRLLLGKLVVAGEVLLHRRHRHQHLHSPHTPLAPPARLLVWGSPAARLVLRKPPRPDYATGSPHTPTTPPARPFPSSSNARYMLPSNPVPFAHPHDPQQELREAETPGCTLPVDESSLRCTRTKVAFCDPPACIDLHGRHCEDAPPQPVLGQQAATTLRHRREVSPAGWN